jgi:hypothetical protein
LGDLADQPVHVLLARPGGKDGRERTVQARGQAVGIGLGPGPEQPAGLLPAADELGDELA